MKRGKGKKEELLRLKAAVVRRNLLEQLKSKKRINIMQNIEDKIKSTVIRSR